MNQSFGKDDWKVVSAAAAAAVAAAAATVNNNNYKALVRAAYLRQVNFYRRRLFEKF